MSFPLEPTPSTTSPAMATTTETMVVQKADSPTLKRAFTPDLVPNSSYRAKKVELEFPTGNPRYSPRRSPDSSEPDTVRHWPRPMRPGQQRPSCIRNSSMPISSSSRPFAPMPSFMSVFGEEVNNQSISQLPNGSLHGTGAIRPASSGNIISGSGSTTVPFSTFHLHRDSTSTLASESSESSPTTTISTMDSSSVTDPSPGPSPESPVAKAVPSSFVPDFRPRRSDSAENSPNTFFELQRPTTPAKKPRNLKNLGINTATSLTNLRGANASSALPVLANKEKNTSAPTSPSFIKPPTPPKRRPSNLSLTIQTPGSDPKPIRLVIPSAPTVQRPGLRHFQSSPSLPLCSPSVAPSGGMQFPLIRPAKPNPHGFAEVPIEVEEDEDQEPNFDIPQSREEKPAAYPNGPICIYESGVFLYFEPTAEEAASYDVIMNVASEVKNPFTTSGSAYQQDLNTRRKDGPPAETVDFAAIPERMEGAGYDSQHSSPTTPKATPILEGTQEPEHQPNGSFLKRPEYIHIPWEHNTDIVPDLHKLVKVIEERVQQGKRVLVHCQCGVSRSASLIVAYGLYKNPGISVQEAYDAVKKRSKWIGPNMNLIMQLQEFRNGLLRANSADRGFHNLGLGRRSAGLPSGGSAGNPRRSPFEMDASHSSRTPRTAPLPPDSDISNQRASTGNMISLTPGPLSAPSGVFFSPGFRRSWAPSQTDFDLSPTSSPISATPYVDPKGHVVPVLSVTQSDSAEHRLEPVENASEPEDDTQLKPLPVPNFSRPVKRLNEEGEPVERTLTISSPRFDDLQAPPLRSPMVSSFSVVSSTNDDSYPNISELMSPIRTEFPSDPFSNITSPPLRLNKPRKLALRQHTSREDEMTSPRASEFHMIDARQNDFDESYGVLSPRATSFDVGPREAFEQEVDPLDPAATEPEMMSPVATEFPKDIFPPIAGVESLDMTSPRAEEFHMTPLIPRIEDEDPFGLTSPRKFEFPKEFDETQLTPPRKPQPDGHPAVHAILPPPRLEQLPSFNGFASLNGTAQSQPALYATAAADDLPIPGAPSLGHGNSLPKELQMPGSFPTESPEPAISNNNAGTQTSFLDTPPRQPPIRTRFSSPNMRQQRKLHKLQTEMEALLPPKSPQAQSFDDIDALMSPRATEFTRNPFHVDLSSPTDEPSPASSNETIKDGQSNRDWSDAQKWTPPKVISEDPRSPAQAGVSPIVRNIWDVL